MVRSTLRLAATGLAALAVSAVPAATASASAGPSGPATVEVTMTKLGPILTNGTGHTLFAFTKDTPNTDTCVMTFGCPLFWPPLTSTGAPVAGAGVNAAMLGTITLPNGKVQVTYGGDPLYGYILNIFPKMTGYVGVTAFGGTWEAVTASGTLIS